ncbi:hypothetical protein MAHJHV57_51730 [Mycobacterium avium subsp. hominissuis]
MFLALPGARGVRCGDVGQGAADDVGDLGDIVGGTLADITAPDAARRRVTGTVEFDSRAPGSARNNPPGPTARESNSTVPVTRRRARRVVPGAARGAHRRA